MAAAALSIGMDVGEVLVFARGMKDAADQAQEIYHSIARASDKLMSVAQNVGIGGGTAGQAGMLGGMARLSGDDPNSTASAARDFRERLATSPIAQATMGRGAMPAETGQLINETQLYLQAQREVLEARTQEEARIKAQRYGLEKLLPLRDADQRLVREEMRMAEENGRLVDENLRKQRANVQVLQAIQSESMERVKIGFQRILLPIEDHFARILITIGNFVGNLFPGPKGTATPQDRNTAALNSMTEELTLLRRDFLNGRERSNRAIPRNWGGHAPDQGLESAAFNLGSVTL
jgi:hypothetical protein